MKRWLSACLLVVLCLGLILPAEPVEAAFTPTDPDFDDVPVISGVPLPTAIAWLPDETLLATGKAGVVYRENGGVSTPILDLTSSVCSGGEMGLLGLAVDPQFGASRPFVFLYYTHKRGSGCGEASGRANRVSRFSMDGVGNLVPSSEVVLLDNIAAKGTNHNGGDLQFGKDGMLYVSVGDSGQDLNGGTGPNGNARRLDLLNGKILRITPDGAIPSDNPFVGTNSTSCAANGQARSTKAGIHAEKKGKKKKRAKKRRKRKQRRNRGNQNPPSSLTCGEIFATGLRNPYRIAFDPDDASAPQRLFINDVGQNTWEEIDEGISGADYGWNLREGPCTTGSTSDCAPDARFVDPVHAYEHTGGCNVITGGAFVPNGNNWPAPHPSEYLFADLGCNTIFAIQEGNFGAARSTFATGEGATHLAFGPDGQLYYTDFDSGAIRKIVYAP